MNKELLVSRILDDEGLAGDLDGDDAQTLVAWLVRRAEAIIGAARSEKGARAQIDALCLRGRAIAQLVDLHCGQKDKDAATAHADREKLSMPAAEDAAGALRQLLHEEEKR